MFPLPMDASAETMIEALAAEAKAMGADPLVVRVGVRRTWPSGSLYRVMILWSGQTFAHVHRDADCAALGAFEELFRCLEDSAKGERMLGGGNRRVRRRRISA